MQMGKVGANPLKSEHSRFFKKWTSANSRGMIGSTITNIVKAAVLLITEAAGMVEGSGMDGRRCGRERAAYKPVFNAQVRNLFAVFKQLRLEGFNGVILHLSTPFS